MSLHVSNKSQSSHAGTSDQLLDAVVLRWQEKENVGDVVSIELGAVSGARWLRRQRAGSALLCKDFSLVNGHGQQRCGFSRERSEEGHDSRPQVWP
ncbi:hypothetical protein NL676_032649 [Syzygium grande]|nr:hypothetical protein NL676_032649 [Syzygium grande]